MRFRALATAALVVVIAGEVAVSVAAATGVVGSIGRVPACHGVSVSVFFQPTAYSAEFQPVLSVLLRSQGVFEIGFLSKHQALDEDKKEFGGTSFTFDLADAPPLYQVIVQTVVDARRIKAVVDTFRGVEAVVVGADISRPYVTASLKPVGVADRSKFYVGTVISRHCPS